MTELRTLTAAQRLVSRRHLSIGSLRVSSYLALLYIGCALGILQGAAVARAAGLSDVRFVLATILLMIPAFGGSRLWYVAQHFEAFRAKPHEIWRSASGGAALYGGLVGGVVAAPLVLTALQLPFLQYWDAASITMLIAVVITRLGCVMNGCCVGRETVGPLGLWLADSRGQWLRRYPTQLLESAWAAVILFVVLNVRSQLVQPGALFASVVAGYATGRLLIEPTRADARPKRATYVNLAFSAALLVVSATALVRLLRQV